MTIPALSLKDTPEDFTEAFCNSLKETGFARIIDHGIDTHRLQHAYQTIQHLFALPLKAKQSCELKDLGIRGYTGFGKEKAKGQTSGDLKEFWHIGKNLSADSPYINIYPENVWPAELPEFKAEFLGLFADLEKIALQLLQHISLGLEIEAEYFPELINDGNSVLRLIHYPPVNGLDTQNQMRAAPHADINLMTLLVGATGSGLQLLDKAGEWQDVQTGPEEIVVDTGDMMALITGNTLPSTIHRVINPDAANAKNNNKPRYSMPFFLHPHSNALLECLPQFENTDNGPSISAGDFLQQRLRENGLIS
jgi:isopenicillin N synthase-like dioxygenase